MANNAVGKTTQEYLNNKAGFTGELRTVQECLASLAGRAGGANLLNPVSEQDSSNTYAGTTEKITQDALNVKVGGGGATLSKQEAARRL